MRKSLIVANWKMHGDLAANRILVTSLLAQVRERKADAVLCPPYPYLVQLSELLQGSDIALGAQDCGHSDKGAYTGEVAPGMLTDCGCSWVILGHSERRQYHAESDALVAAKITAALRNRLMPIVCVGETQEQREAGSAEAVVEEQLRGALVDQVELGGIVVAYEPVWAIGTGLTASPEQAQEMHAFIRDVLASLDAKGASATRLLYGGSVKADNAKALFRQDDIDGALVGGASLDADAFASIVNAAS
ncbi:MAG: triose-phosphate isomerase [Congregibacter sp.]